MTRKRKVHTGLLPDVGTHYIRRRPGSLQHGVVIAAGEVGGKLWLRLSLMQWIGTHQRMADILIGESSLAEYEFFPDQATWLDEVAKIMAPPALPS